VCFPATVSPIRVDYYYPLLLVTVRCVTALLRSAPLPPRSRASVTSVYKKNTFNRWLEICLNIRGYAVKNNGDTQTGDIAARRFYRYLLPEQK